MLCNMFSAMCFASLSYCFIMNDVFVVCCDINAVIDISVFFKALLCVIYIKLAFYSHFLVVFCESRVSVYTVMLCNMFSAMCFASLS